MAYKVVIEKTAQQEFDNIVFYLSQVLCSRQAAQNFMSEFSYQVEQIKEAPYFRPKSHIPLLAKQGYRSFHVGRDLAIYKVRNDKLVVIAHIVHLSQNYARLI